MRKLSKSVKKLAAIAGATSALVALPVLAQNMPTSSEQTQPSSTQTQPQVEPKPMTPSASPRRNSTMKQRSNVEKRSIVDVVASNPSFKTLTAALKAAGLTDTLASGGPYTLFAPTDASFAALPKGMLEQLLRLENKDTLIKILTYHVLPGQQTSAQLRSGQLTTLEGSPVNVKVANGGVRVNGAKVTRANIPARNGVIHVINKVIMPPDIERKLLSP